MPDGMSFAQAAAFQVAYGTSHLALTHRARLQPGETLLGLGAAGGVGLGAVEIGRLLGARVIGVAPLRSKLSAPVTVPPALKGTVQKAVPVRADNCAWICTIRGTSCNPTGYSTDAS